MIKENIDADNIIPEAKPKKIWLTLGDIPFFLKKKTKDDPRVVQKNIKKIPNIEYKYVGIMLLSLVSLR